MAHFFRRLAAVAAGIAGSVGSAQAADIWPCVDSRGTTPLLMRTLRIQTAGRPDVVKVGTISSIDAATGDVRFAFEGIAREQVAHPATIAIETRPPNMMSQMPLPVRKSLGVAHARYALKNVVVRDGVVTFPGCTPPAHANEIAFIGSLGVEAGQLSVDGEFFEVRLPDGGRFDAGGVNKPGS